MSNQTSHISYYRVKKAWLWITLVDLLLWTPYIMVVIMSCRFLVSLESISLHSVSFTLKSACCSTQLWGQWAPAKTSDRLEGGNYFFLTMILNVHGWFDFKAILSDSLQWTRTTHGRKCGLFGVIKGSIFQFLTFHYFWT